MKMKTLLYFAVIVLLIALIEARGGRGGGRGGRFSSRSRSGYRSSSRSRYVSKFSGSRISSKSQLRTAILLGTVYGATRWKSRSSYRRSGELPEVCYNDKYDQNQWGNSTYLGRFLCPTDQSMGDNKKYCCGEKGKQYCCTFWEDGGRVAGVVIGILVFMGIIFVTCYCCIKRRKKSSGSVIRTPDKNHFQMAPDPTPVPMAGPPMGSSPYSAPQSGPPPSGAPPPYELAGPAPGGLPYDPNPKGDLPYPVNPPPFQYQQDQGMEKPPMPSDGSQPYPTAPPLSGPHYGDTPYPTGNPPYPAGNPVYPPMGNMPYPPNNAPYPNQ
nr:uncharacterized protein LOC105327640 isoform X2 [Crassostrea gigas]